MIWKQPMQHLNNLSNLSSFEESTRDTKSEGKLPVMQSLYWSTDSSSEDPPLNMSVHLIFLDAGELVTGS